ncbi:MAG: nucleoside recognition domain-containing protein, partial [Coleofasciculus sp. C2-GNP5-27]
ANLAEVPGNLLDPLGISVGDVSNLEAAAEEQEVTTGTFGAMVQRFDGRAGAFAYLLFVLMYFPCVAATAAIYRETNVGWTVFVAAWSTGLAYWSATLFYQGAILPQQPGTSLAWMAGLVLVMATTIVGFKIAQPVRRNRRQMIGN